MHMWAEVQSVLINVRGGKNDIQGEGHRFELPAVSMNSERAYDIAYDCFQWASVGNRYKDIHSYRIKVSGSLNMTNCRLQLRRSL